MTQTFWLLDVEIDGRPYRWSTENLEVTTADGDVLLYVAGLEDPGTLAAGDEADVAVFDESVDWPTLAPQIEGRAAVLRRWTEGTVLEAAEAYAAGRAVSVEYETRHDPVVFSIAQQPGELSLGTQVPDELAKVDEQTWPMAANHEVGNIGAYYPVIFGFPGYRGTVPPSEPPAYACVPVPVAEWSDTTSPAHAIIIVAEDVAAPVTAVWLRNDDNGGGATYSTQMSTDLLGRMTRQVQVADYDMLFPLSKTGNIFAGFYPAVGGGVARTAYDVIAYVLARWGVGSVDWNRLRSVEDVLVPYAVDTWIDDAQTDPWAWLEMALLPDLPVEIRTSERGRYLVHKRYVSDPSLRVGSISVDAGEAVRFGAVRRDNVDIVNQLTASYRADRDGNWLGRLILTGDPAVIQPPSAAAALTYSGETQSVTLARSARCLASHARYGARLPIGGPLTIDWTWDESTVLRVLEDTAERDALPARMVWYEVFGGDDLVEGDEVLLTDTEVGLEAVPAIVDEPPVRSTDSTTVRLRIPEEV